MQQSNSSALAVVGRCMVPRIQLARQLSQTRGLEFVFPSPGDLLCAKRSVSPVGTVGSSPSPGCLPHGRRAPETLHNIVIKVHRPARTGGGTGIWKWITCYGRPPLDRRRPNSNPVDRREAKRGRRGTRSEEPHRLRAWTAEMNISSNPDQNQHRRRWS